MEPFQTSIYEFDDFRVDPGRRLLLGRDGRPLPLTPKALDTLIYLVQHADTVLGKETLMRAVWADTVVEENNLNQCISALRRALGENRAEHRYIVTVPGRGYRFVAPVIRRTSSAPVSSDESMPSLAVLPFQPLSRDHRDESLELGMADTLITRLSSIREIVVRPTSAVRRYSDSKLDGLAAGRELRVEFVLEGSLQHQSDRVRVTVRLLRVSNGASLWAATFDKQMTDIFSLQDAISERVVQALSLHLSQEEKSRLVKHHTQNAKAYQLYLKGRYYWWKNSPEEYRRSRDYFHRTVEEDPSYALGYCGLNSFYGFGAAWGFLPPDDGWPKAEWAVRKALELDDQLAEAHLDLAALKMVFYLDWENAEKEAKRALALSPGFDEIHYMYSFFLLVMRRFPEAIAEGERALVCNPFSLRIRQHLAFTFHCARRYDEAIAQYRKAIELEPGDASVCEALGDAYEQRGEFDQAVDHWRKAMLLAEDAELACILNPSDPVANFKRGVRELAAKRLDRLQQKRAGGAYVPAILFARQYLRAARNEDAMRALTEACEERNAYALLLASDPFYDPLRSDPRFAKLLRRMKLHS